MVEQTFHEAIRSGDAAARLIYADWLEEHERGEEAALLRSGRWYLVPAGSFWMGGGGGKAGKQQVEIPHAFFLGAFTVTQGEWRDVMGNNPSHFSRDGNGKDKVKNISDVELKNFPVETVSWDDAQEYFQKLNEQKHVSGFLYRFPTEAEWEYACRGGATSKKECSFHFYVGVPTNTISSTQANFNGNFPVGKAKKGEYLERTTRVGSYCPNRLGLYDMHGNVWEWCQDFYEPEGSDRVIRGGSWSSNGRRCRSGYRGLDEPTDVGASVGFRVALVPVR
jgi:eukaryotic-like serine/threonine-protein kinase